MRGSEIGAAEYWRYWGKAMSSGSGALFHLLPCHCLDVAAVGSVYLRANRQLLAWLRQMTGFDSEDALVAWVCFWLALHDLGKFSLSFQGLRADLLRQLQGDLPERLGLPDVRHDSLGAWIWHDALDGIAQDESWFGPLEDASDGLPHWVHAVMGHHGQPPLTNPTQMHLHFRRCDRAAAEAFVREARELFQPPPLPTTAGANGESHFTQHSAKASWWMAGLAVLADWIGSNTAWFGYVDQTPTSMGTYWERATAQAELALREVGVLPCAKPATQSFAELFPEIAQASPLQRWADTVEIAPAPQIHLLEDVTGAGKTEAAVMLTHRLMAAGVADGFFIGLPTMATANAMYHRMAGVYGRLFPHVASLVLAHGRKDLVEAFAESVLRAGPEEHDPHQPDDSASSRCTRWLADHNKRALLAPAGVGTIDQALLASLESKHQSLRLLGLFRKVLIVDEVHACDAYMQGTLETLLTCHAAAGGSAILLSATLPARMKKSLLAAFARGQGQQAFAALPQAYPLATSWPGQPDTTTARETPLATRIEVSRRVRVHYEADLDQIVNHIAETVRSGQCVAWIRNTISDVMAAHDILKAQVPVDRITLFHSRFTLGDRLDTEELVLEHLGPRSHAQQRHGRLLLATQVAEQSLDADLDLLVSDLAPIDRLIQRAGRLRRHTRSAAGDRLPSGRPDERGEPWLWVHGPRWTEAPEADWFKAALPKAAYVYQDHGQLWLTAQLLQAGQLSMPGDARRLIESVFGEDTDLPAALQGSNTRAEGKGHGDRALARINSIKFNTGYLRSGTDWLSDTSAPSRLGDESVDVALARWDGDTLLPWRDDKVRHPWAYSTVRAPRRLIDEPVAPTSPARQAALEVAKSQMPGGGKWVRLLAFDLSNGQWLAQGLGQPSGKLPGRLIAWRYDPVFGLAAQTASGA